MERQVLTKRTKEKGVAKRRVRGVSWMREVIQRKKMIAIRKIVMWKKRKNQKRKVSFFYHDKCD